MKTFLLLACILSTLHLFCSSEDTLHPIYSFRCLESTGVELYGVHRNSTIHVESPPTNCSDPIQNENTGIFLIEYNCMEKYATVNITVHDPDIDGTTITHSTTATGNQTVTTSPLYKGGRGSHEFTITCNDIPDEGVNKTVAHVFHETDYNQLPKNYKEVDGVEMRFKAVNSIKAPDINNIYVGDEFYMYIRYMGASKYWVVPEKCEAFGGTTVPKNYKVGSGSYVELWNYEKYGCAKYNELLEPFERVKNILVYAKMYGFRFTNDEYVTITCDVRMYPNEQEICRDPLTTPAPPTTTAAPTPLKTAVPTSLTTAAPTPSTTAAITPLTTAAPTPSTTGGRKRRKRDIGNVNFQTHSVFNKMRVLDSKDVYQQENKSQHNNCGISVWIVALITTTLYRQWT